MTLLVVPLAPDDVHLLTLAEWDAVTARDTVLFERADHPLLRRLLEGGVAAGPLDDEPDAGDPSAALVADPGSERVIDLARAGAEVTVGPAPTPDALTAARAATVARRAAVSLGALVAVMARLRSVDGCPWDREQSHESLRIHLLEEAHEVLEAIDRGTLGEELEEELGDLLLQVAFHSQLAADDGRFDIAGVAERIVAKLVHRHPHVFGDVNVTGASEVVTNWEALKAAEKERGGPFDGIPAGLPALLSAYKVQKRAAARGFRPAEESARARVRDALAADPDPATLGEALFGLVAIARARGIDPEGALRAATLRFRSSF